MRVRELRGEVAQTAAASGEQLVTGGPQLGSDEGDPGSACQKQLGLAWDITRNKWTPEAHEAQRAAAPVPAQASHAALPILPTVVEEELVSGD